MFELIGVLAVCGVVIFACFAIPVFIGVLLSDRRRDDGYAAYASIPISILCGSVSVLLALIYLINKF